MNITCFKTNVFWWDLEFYYAKPLPYAQMTISNNKTRSTMQKTRKCRSSCQVIIKNSKNQWENGNQTDQETCKEKEEVHAVRM